MKIALLHYHLKRGGVTRVLEAQVQALRDLGHEPYVVASGEDCSGAQLPHTRVDELAYTLRATIGGTRLLETIHKTLPWKPDLWIVHNPTLGKNASMPSFLTALVKGTVPIILQFHDFAEDGRPDNYHLLAGKQTYPIAPHISYAFINSRDRDLLIKAGLPKKRCHLLPNAVNPPEALPAGEQKENIILYPVRGIRRKNLGEICLLAKHAPAGTQFAITLAPENKNWQQIHDRWVQVAAELELPVTFAAVTEKDSFESWLSRATHTVTTSIAEGFGLSFLEPAFLRKPLIGRDLPEITNDFLTEGITLGTLYRSLPVPVPEGLKSELREELIRMYASYERVFHEDLVTEAWEALVKNDRIDFGNLPEHHQEAILRGPRFSFITEWLSLALAQRESSITTDQLASTDWSQKHYTKNINTLIQGCLSIKAGKLKWLENHRVIEQFLSPARFHFLRT